MGICGVKMDLVKSLFQEMNTLFELPPEYMRKVSEGNILTIDNGFGARDEGSYRSKIYIGVEGEFYDDIDYRYTDHLISLLENHCGSSITEDFDIKQKLNSISADFQLTSDKKHALYSLDTENYMFAALVDYNSSSTDINSTIQMQIMRKPGKGTGEDILIEDNWLKKADLNALLTGKWMSCDIDKGTIAYLADFEADNTRKHQPRDYDDHYALRIENFCGNPLSDDDEKIDALRNAKFEKIHVDIIEREQLHDVEVYKVKGDNKVFTVLEKYYSRIHSGTPKQIYIRLQPISK